MQTQTEFHTNDCPHAPQCSPDNNGPCWQAFKAVCGMGVGMMANVAMGGAPFEMNMNMTTTSSHYNNGASVSVSVPTPAVSVNIPAPGFQVNMSIPAVQVAVPVIQFSAPLPFPVQPYAGNKSFVEIFLDKPYYLAGETVQGRCELSVHQHISHAHSLMIKWKGFERTLVEVFVNKQENGQNVRERQKFKENKEFFSSALTLFNFGGSGVPPGKYTFPFSYKLPANLPGVFYDAHEEVDGEKIRAAIVYKVKCWLDMKGKDIKKDYKIVISEPVTKQITAVHEENKKSFLLARGECKLKVDLQKNVFVPGESIPVKVLVENESSKKVDALKVKLMRTVKVKAQQHKKDHISEVSRMKYDGVDKKTNKDTVLNFVLDNKVFPSTSGSLVECRYHLDIECDVAMAADLEVHPKITIALLPAAGQPVLLYQNYAPRAW